MLAEEIHKKYYPIISDRDFNLIVSADELTSNLQKSKLGKYAKWLLRLFVKKRMKTEDLYKAKEYITIYDKLLKSNKLSIKDINKYNSLSAMYVVVKPYLNRPAISKTETIIITKQNEAEKLFEDETFTVIYPKTQAASCLYGSNTEWCTAAKHYDGFSYYNERGKLYIIINKISGKKYQFHFETNGYNDETDERISQYPIEALTKISATEELKAFFLNERKYDRLLVKDSSVRIIRNRLNYQTFESVIHKYKLCIIVFNNRYGIKNMECGNLIFPFEYDMIEESYVPSVYEATKNGQTDLYLLKREYTTEIVSLKNCENVSIKFTLPFYSGYLFPIGKSDFLHFLEFANKQFKAKNPDYQANCIVTNLFTAIMLEIIFSLQYDIFIEFKSLKKQIDEAIEKSRKNMSRKVRGSFWINKIDWYIIVDQEIKSGVIRLQTFDILLS
jgi:hypothetical protein